MQDQSKQDVEPVDSEDPEDIHAPLRATTDRILRALIIQIVQHGRPNALTADQQAVLLEPFEPELEAFGKLIHQVGLAYERQALEHTRASLHGQPGVDDAMLDEVLEYHTTRDGDGEPVAL